MNIWIEYWEKSKEPSKNTHAQIREQDRWVPPDPKITSKIVSRPPLIKTKSFSQALTQDLYTFKNIRRCF